MKTVSFGSFRSSQSVFFHLLRNKRAQGLQTQVTRDRRFVRVVSERDGDERREQRGFLFYVGVVREGQIRQPLR
jgi:hypothetical protein